MDVGFTPRSRALSRRIPRIIKRIVLIRNYALLSFIEQILSDSGCIVLALCELRGDIINIEVKSITPREVEIMTIVIKQAISGPSYFEATTDLGTIARDNKEDLVATLKWIFGWKNIRVKTELADITDRSALPTF